jgi:SNF2 family DNA or RNA helicase
VRRALIVCPASLVGNWGNELRKWLGDMRLEPLLVEGGTGKEAGLYNHSLRSLTSLSFDG